MLLCLDGYLKLTFLNSIIPLGCETIPVCLGSIADASSIIEKTVYAAAYAFEIDGIWDMETPDPIAPTKTT